MKRIFLSFTGILFTASLTVASVTSDTAFAATCGDVETVVISCGTNENALWSVLLILVRILAFGVGVVAVGGIVYAAFLYTTAADNLNQVTLSRNNIQAIVIGLVAFAGMYSFIEFAIPGGAFNRSYSAPIATSDLPGVEDGAPDSNGAGSNGSSSADDGDAKDATVKIATYNVLGFNHDTSASKYSNSTRMQRAANIIKDTGVQAFVANEINVNEQRNTILDSLDGWGATTRQSGNQDVFIFWDKDVFKLVNSGTYNIPVMPGQPTRPQPWVKLEHKVSKRKIFIYGNHLAQTSHGNNQQTGASATVEKVKNTLDQNENSVAIVAGDMNTNDNRGYAYNVFKNSGILYDARHATSNLTGNNCDTHHDLGGQDCRPTRGSHIDQIWISKKPKSTVNSYRVVANDETAHVSDHNPLIISLTIPASK